MRVRILAWASLEDRHKEKILSRSEQDISAVVPLVQEIIDRVRRDGDAALVRYSREFNDADLSGIPLAVSDQEFADAEKVLDASVKDAIRFCARNVRTCHERQLPTPMSLGEVRPGVYAGERATPIDSVGPVRSARQGKLPLIDVHDGRARASGRRSAPGRRHAAGRPGHM